MNISFNNNEKSFGMAHIPRKSLKGFSLETNNAIEKYILKDLKSGESLVENIDVEYSKAPLSKNLTLTIFTKGQNKIIRFFDRMIKDSTLEDKTYLPKAWINSHKLEMEIRNLKKDFLEKEQNKVAKKLKRKKKLKKVKSAIKEKITKIDEKLFGRIRESMELNKELKEAEKRVERIRLRKKG